jgi:hypothetical protein
MDWRIEQNLATLSRPALRATLDLARPHDGLTSVAYRDRPFSGHLLGVAVEPNQDSCAGSLVDSYARVGDLVATYAQTPTRPTRVQVYWRTVAEIADSAGAEAVDLQVSVQTSLLDAAAVVVAQSRLNTSETHRLIDVDAVRFEPIDLPTTVRRKLTPADGPGCLVFRSASGDMSYVEMIHPADFHEDALVREFDGMISLSHDLFVSSLEKGVILRARVRGLFLPRDNDLPAAADAYRAFVDSKLPLTT